MRFTPTAVAGAMIVEAQRTDDERGFFSRVFCAREFAAHGMESTFVQASVSRNRRAHTLRGMHFQAQPYPEAKLISCRAGAIFDVVADMRMHSPTFGRWFSVELTADNGKAVYVPKDCAHGFMTITAESEVPDCRRRSTGNYHQDRLSHA
jgi:dTDP-4-dehydrorhamnose 3,5-epimerase